MEDVHFFQIGQTVFLRFEIEISRDPYSFLLLILFLKSSTSNSPAGSKIALAFFKLSGTFNQTILENIARAWW